MVSASLIDESVVEERLKKKYEDSFRDIEEKAVKGISQRDEAIKKLKTEKSQLASELKDKIKKLGQLEDENERLKASVNELQDSNKNGEALLINQVKDLKS